MGAALEQCEASLVLVTKGKMVWLLAGPITHLYHVHAPSLLDSPHSFQAINSWVAPSAAGTTVMGPAVAAFQSPEENQTDSGLSRRDQQQPVGKLSQECSAGDTTVPPQGDLGFGKQRGAAFGWGMWHC